MERMTLKSFTACMLLCAILLLTAIWLGGVLGETFTERTMKTAATFFILGLASFLIWAPLLAYRFLAKHS